MTGGTSTGEGRSDVPARWSAQRAESSTGILATWNAAGVLTAADVLVVDRLIRLCGEPVDDACALAAALAVRAVRLGSTCLALDDVSTIAEHAAAAVCEEAPLSAPTAGELVAALRVCPLVVGGDAGPLRPLVLVDSDDGVLLYLQKYHLQEQTIRRVLAERGDGGPDLEAGAVEEAIDAAFGFDEAKRGNDRQRLAVATAATRWITILAGGPGTGKTFTVARMLTALDHLAGRGLRIGLCAPTGRAAAALQASVSADPAAPDSVRALTVHSLLGWRPGSTPRYDRGNTLPHDVVVVDETSMLSMTAMSYLLDAVRPDARIVLVGDPHQLASVDAGAVLADLVDRAGAESSDAGEGGVITLSEGYRFRAGIGAVADAVNGGDADRVAELVTDPGVADVELIDPTDLDAVREDIVAWGRGLRTAAHAGDVAAALDTLDTHRVLCAHREGSWGVQGWSSLIVDWLGHDPAGAFRASGGWGSRASTVTFGVGEPILVTANDRQTDTFNGDCGVVVSDRPDPRTDNPLGISVAFRRGSEVNSVHPARLADVVPAYAMTIHRSQGSQFDAVTVVLPPPGSELLTRELLYTAITRAKKKVRIVGTVEVLKAAVDRRVHRASGLRSQTRPIV